MQEMQESKDGESALQKIEQNKIRSELEVQMHNNMPGIEAPPMWARLQQIKDPEIS
jgi:hypothetical protein